MLSVIVPVYNAEAFLARCLDSLLRQGVKDYEVICVNDVFIVQKAMPFK